MSTRIFISLIILILCTSCFEEDEALPPYISPYNVIALDNSLYSHQTYVHLGSGTNTTVVENQSWTLAFDCDPLGSVIRINSSDLLGIAATGDIDINMVFSETGQYDFKADKSDGNLDSTAVGKWAQLDEGSYAYTNEVYLIGKYDGIGFEAFKKVQFYYVDETSYKFYIGDPESTQVDSVVLTKDPQYTSLQYNAMANEILRTEPLKDEWELLFGQYQTVLYTEDGIATTYYVRGTLLNPNEVQAALDTINSFEEINYALSSQLNLSQTQDFIGHDWKSVTVDQATNGAEYKVRPNHTYIIKDASDQYFKLRFTDYFNGMGLKGYPSFEYELLEP